MSETIAGYRVLSRIGDGGMGSVYLVQHPRLPRQEALKLVAAELSSDPVYRARFAREADVLAALDHPNIVRLHDRGEVDGQLWLTMEYIDGSDAATLMHRQGRLPLPVVVDIVRAVAAALDYAWHTSRLAHRDVKPANVLMGRRTAQDGTASIKLADFGVATGPERTQLTATGMAVGTLGYLAPESLGDAQVDDRSDQYSLACTAYHLLTGRPPYGDGSPATLLRAHLYESLPAPSTQVSGLPPHVDAVIARATAKDPRERFPSSTAFAQALAAAPHPAAPPAPRPAPGQPAPPQPLLQQPAAQLPGAQSPKPRTRAMPAAQWPDPPHPYPPVPPPADADDSGKGRSRRSLLIAGGIGGVLLLLLAGLGAWLVLRGSDDPAPVPLAAPSSTSASASASSSPPPFSPSSPAPSSSDDAPLSAIFGTWTGTYLCRQGESAVTITIKRGLIDDQVNATFAFGPTPQNPDTEPGSFQMAGVRLGDDVMFSPLRWIDRPGDYEMVPMQLDGPFTADTTRLTGRILSPGCGAISVRR